MNYTILGLTALAIAIVAVKMLWNEVNRNWGDLSVKHKEGLKNEARDITGYVPLAEYKTKDRAGQIKDEELGKLVGLMGKTHTAKLAEGRD